ncbi:hypothetical protein BHU72_00805 [Desulfuribacillus stibiiarsenatis]|uniref:ParB/Sulfiredoxin domain-containing protein n=1 Tax=Desulfuribacillus stibiiarsenatis TaxID=1390249 RepID=A0A1E5L9U9_9FIRM|nr:hypothetical protein [Desulfuribacillus stibiiarsenatis]OEH86838.1 hypothetical protein BHU72_00805 [Desulfuribacillus stibiiarsenatis]
MQVRSPIIRLASHSKLKPIYISTFYYDRITTDTALKRLKTLKNFDYSRPILIVEKNKNSTYTLIEGFNEYSALMELEPNNEILCRVLPESNEKAQLLRILNKVITLEQTSWIFKHYHVKKLINDHNMKPFDISEAIKQPLSSITRYLYSERIPDHINHLSKINDATNMVNQIARSKFLADPIRLFLFDKAVLPKNNCKRLKQRQLEHVIIFFKNFSLSDYELSNLNFIENLLRDITDGDKYLLKSWENALDNMRTNTKADRLYWNDLAATLNRTHLLQ